MEYRKSDKIGINLISLIKIVRLFFPKNTWKLKLGWIEFRRSRRSRAKRSAWSWKMPVKNAELQKSECGIRFGSSFYMSTFQKFTPETLRRMNMNAMNVYALSPRYVKDTKFGRLPKLCFCDYISEFGWFGRIKKKWFQKQSLLCIAHVYSCTMYSVQLYNAESGQNRRFQFEFSSVSNRCRSLLAIMLYLEVFSWLVTCCV